MPYALVYEKDGGEIVVRETTYADLSELIEFEAEDILDNDNEDNGEKLLYVLEVLVLNILSITYKVIKLERLKELARGWIDDGKDEEERWRETGGMNKQQLRAYYDEDYRRDD